MPPLNILHVLRAPVGGLFRHVVDLVRGQIARGHNVGIVADSLTGDVSADALLMSLVPLLALGLSRTPIPRQFGLNDFSALWHVGKRVRETQADVVHGHGAKGGAFARMAFASKPAVRAYTPHGGSLLLDDSGISGKAYLALERMLMPRGSLYLFESAFSASVFAARIGRAKGLVRVVHNGVSAAEFDPIPLAGDATDIIFLGELRTVKGIDVLLDAIAHLRHDGTPLTATIVGSGGIDAELRTQAESLGLASSIRFLPPMKARAAMALGRLMVIPSRAESLPYVVLEAAAAGKPLITTDVGGIPEIYGPLSNTLIPAGDSVKLAETIARAIREPAALYETTRLLRQQVAASFSSEAMVDGVIEAYEQALLRGPARDNAALAHA